MDRQPLFFGGKRTTSLIAVLLAVLLVGSTQARDAKSPEKILALGLPTLSGEVTV